MFGSAIIRHAKPIELETFGPKVVTPSLTARQQRSGDVPNVRENVREKWRRRKNYPYGIFGLPPTVLEQAVGMARPETQKKPHGSPSWRNTS